LITRGISFKLDYLGGINITFKTNSGYESGDQVGSFDEKKFNL
jgi:hypothetical protein